MICRGQRRGTDSLTVLVGDDRQKGRVRDRSWCRSGCGRTPLHLRIGTSRRRGKAAASMVWSCPTVGSLGRGSAEQRGQPCVPLLLFRRSHPFLVHHPAEDAGREQQAIPVSGRVALIFMDNSAPHSWFARSEWLAARPTAVCEHRPLPQSRILGRSLEAGATWRRCHDAASGRILTNNNPFQSFSISVCGESWLSRADWLAVCATVVSIEDKRSPLLIMHEERRLELSQ